eukprot:519651-Pleurochrysis_carterae.AAC.1
MRACLSTPLRSRSCVGAPEAAAALPLRCTLGHNEPLEPLGARAASHDAQALPLQLERLLVAALGAAKKEEGVPNAAQPHELHGEVAPVAELPPRRRVSTRVARANVR